MKSVVSGRGIKPVAQMEERAPELLARTPLFELCQMAQGRMVNFAGWEMAVQFGGITQEHQAVRQRVGMFDISHMGKFVLRGPGLIEQLQRLVPSDLARLQPGQAQYTLFLNAQAKILDDLIFYYQGEVEGVPQGVMIVNAATCAKDKGWLLEHLDPTQVELQDLSPNRVLLALQGPNAIATLQPLVEADLLQLPAFGHLTTQVLGQPGWIARTGYTGEDGFEIMVDPAVGVELWRSLLSQGVTPCGLGARDTLRLEAAMSLYGQDIDETTTPLDASLGWVIHWPTKGDFIGRTALEQQRQTGNTQQLVGIRMEGKNIARHGYPVWVEGAPVGQVTSGTLSPTLGYPIALAYVSKAVAQLGQPVQVEIRGKTYPGAIVKRPFYKRSR